jgi:transposase InsO family protein
MAWKEVDIHEQRVRFVVAATQGMQPFSSLCTEFGISHPTGYLWLHPYQVSGLSGIAERSRKPRFSPRRTNSRLEQHVVRARWRYPDWGAWKLRVVLSRKGIELPRSTVHRILLCHDLVRDEDRRAPALQKLERDQPNELWQMDFKEPKGWPQSVGPLSVLDDHSRYLIALAVNGTIQGEPARQQLEKAFQHNGVPEEMLMDHGSLQSGLTGRGIPRQDLQAWLNDYCWEHYHVRLHEAVCDPPAHTGKKVANEQELPDYLDW